MKAGRSTGAPTKAQQMRFVAIKEIGCIVCLARGMVCPAEIHHLTVGGKHGQKRRGHDYTVGLCVYCHRGIGNPADYGGPSYAREPKAFRALWPDDKLLAEQDRLIEIWRGSVVK